MDTNQKSVTLLYRCPKCGVGRQLEAATTHVGCMACHAQVQLLPEGHTSTCQCATCTVFRRTRMTRPLQRHVWTYVPRAIDRMGNKSGRYECPCGLVRIKDHDADTPRYHRDGYQVSYHPNCTRE